MAAAFSKNRLLAGLLTVVSLVCIAGCGTGPLVGVLYTSVRLPLTKDLNETPVVKKNATSKVIKIKEPLSGYGIYAEVNSNAIGEIASRHGFNRVYFADQELFSILGIWTTTNIIIYGETEAAGPKNP